MQVQEEIQLIRCHHHGEVLAGTLRITLPRFYRPGLIYAVATLTFCPQCYPKEYTVTWTNLRWEK